MRSSSPPRTERRHPAAAAAGTLLRCGALVLLGSSSYWAIRLAWADHLSRSSRIADRERAVRLAPAIATLYERLAEAREAVGDNSLPDLERAAALDPENADRRQRLGLRAELAGNFTLAEHSLLAAALRSRLYQPRYLLAQYYFRRENADGFWRWSRAAFESAYGDVTPLLDLCWRLRPDADWLARQAIPQRPEIARQYLVFLEGKGQREAAQDLARRISETAMAADRPILLDYCERRLSAGDAAAAVTVWNALCRRGLLPYQPLDAARGILLTNAGFEYAPSGKGFDWRLTNTPGVLQVRAGRGIRLTFSGRQQEQCMIAWQYIPVERAAHYRLHFELHAADAADPVDGAGAEGVGWTVLDQSGPVLGAGSAPARSLAFSSAQNEVVRLALMYQRPSGRTRREGTVAITGLRLEKAP